MARFEIKWRRTIAELLTIVAGVLLALAADDWRISVRERAEAADYQTRLDQALAADLAEFERTAEYAAAVDSAALRVLAVHRGAEVQEGQTAELVAAVLRASWMLPPSVSRDTYDDLVMTGNLRLLSIDARERLGAYYGRVRVYEERELIYRDRLATSYWTVPARVLGPDLLPATWQAIADFPPDEPIAAERLLISAAQLDDIVARIRGIPELERWLADVRHVMLQREVRYGERLADQARLAREALAPTG